MDSGGPMNSSRRPLVGRRAGWLGEPLPLPYAVGRVKHEEHGGAAPPLGRVPEGVPEAGAEIFAGLVPSRDDLRIIRGSSAIGKPGYLDQSGADEKVRRGRYLRYRQQVRGLGRDMSMVLSLLLSQPLGLAPPAPPPLSLLLLPPLLSPLPDAFPSRLSASRVHSLAGTISGALSACVFTPRLALVLLLLVLILASFLLADTNTSYCYLCC